MISIAPQTPEQLADALHSLSTEDRTIGLGNSPWPADANIATRCMKRLLEYDPRDLTVSVEAGMPFAELEQILAEHRQMLPLDPIWRDATVGGVVAANLSGPRRRLYGTARDMIIGMTFATLEGKLVQSGGMVVKNVAGLDMAKLMVGSFGTLAAIATVNFKVFPMPEASRSFAVSFPSAAQAFSKRDAVIHSVLQPAAIDIVNWPDGYRLLLRAQGSTTVLDRFARELPDAQVVEESVWDEIRDFTPRFLQENPHGAVAPMSMKLSEMADAMPRLKVPAIARAGSGIIYAHCAETAAAHHAETAAAHDAETAHLADNGPPVEWSGDFATMEKIKQMFDPERLLNRGRLFNRI